MPVPPEDHIARFLAHIRFQKRYSQHTLEAYQGDLSDFSRFVETQFDLSDLTEVRSAMARTWLASLKESGMVAKTINRKLSSLKSFYKFLLKQQTITASPVNGLMAPRIPKRLPKYVEEPQMETLLQHVEYPDTWDGLTRKLIISLLYQTGMRRAELVGLKERMVDFSNSQIKVLGKGNKERVIPVSKELRDEIQQYIRQKTEALEQANREHLLVLPSGKPLYPRYVYQAVTESLALVTTLEKKSPHILRHSFATHLTNHGADLNAVKELLGHSSLAATQVYTHNNIDKLREVYKKAHPKA